MPITNNEHKHMSLRVGLIGDPVAHSYSPRFQQAALDALDIPARYELWQTPPSELAMRVTSLLDTSCLGANVTIPHKEAVLPLMDTVDPLAARIGAVNTIVHRDGYLHGYNTDAPGLLYALAEQGIGEQRARGERKLDICDTISLRGYTAVLLGAGGAARSAAFALASARVTRLMIVNRHLERAQHLAAEIQQSNDCQVFTLSDANFLIPHARSLIINATPVGMHVTDREHVTGELDYQEATSPLSAEVLARFAADTCVLDMVYNPIETRLLCQARMLGLRTVNGLPMLLHQGALAFTLWTNLPAPLEVMRATIM